MLQEMSSSRNIGDLVVLLAYCANAAIHKLQQQQSFVLDQVRFPSS